jgi:hypothetical protein
MVKCQRLVVGWINHYNQLSMLYINVTTNNNLGVMHNVGNLPWAPIQLLAAKSLIYMIFIVISTFMYI